MATNNSCNFSLGNLNETLTMTGTNVMAFRGRSQSAAARSLNSSFQVSPTRDCAVSYSVDISCTLSLTGGQSGTVILEMATNVGFTTGVQTLCQFTNSNTGALTIGLSLTQTNTACLTYPFIPSGNYLRLRTVTGIGAAAAIFTYQVGSEVLL